MASKVNSVIHWWKENTNTTQSFSENRGSIKITCKKNYINNIFIPKPEVDVTIKDNYRTVSFMNIDLKILNKILEHRIQYILKGFKHMTK